MAKGTLKRYLKLGNVPVNSLFESELERRFVEALAQMGNDSRKVEISKVLVHSKEGYLLKIGTCSWEIEPQVWLDAQYGVSIRTRADFVLWPMRAAEGQRPVAIYTDGFLYHKDKVTDDTLKRESIRRSNKFRIWSLSWKDVQNVFHAQGDYAIPTLIPQNMPSGSRVYRPTVEAGRAQALHPDKVSAFELLARYLEEPNAEELFAVHAKAFSLSLLDARNVNNGVTFADWKNRIMPVVSSLDLQDDSFELSDTLFGKWLPHGDTSHLIILAGIVHIRNATAKSKRVYRLYVWFLMMKIAVEPINMNRNGMGFGSSLT